MDPAIERNLTNHLRTARKTVNKGIPGSTTACKWDNLPTSVTAGFQNHQQYEVCYQIPTDDITKPRLQLIRCLAQGQGICGDGGDFWNTQENGWCLNRKYIEKVDPRNRNH